MSPREPTDELLSAYLDGEVSPAEQAAVESSLATSPERRAALAALAATRDAVRGLGEPVVPADLDDSLHIAVAARIRDADVVTTAMPPSIPDEAGPHRSARRGLAWIAGGVAAAALVAALVIPASQHVDPAVRRRVDTHAARASVGEDPVSELAPIATTAGALRR